ncbi:MAG: hypothetical protein WC617_01725 [Rhodanobacter sp.]|jgi:hypothetical protein
MAAHAGDAGLLWRRASLLGPLAECLRASCRRDSAVAVSRRHLRLSPARLLAGLPALGDVLYLSSHAGGAQLRELPQGVLLESICLAPLLQCVSLLAASAITVEGPQEWIECQDADGRTCARLCLLPDSDYLAWDALHAGACSTTAGVPAPPARPWRPANAHLLRFHARGLAGLQVLRAETSSNLSPLSRQVAGRIARDDAGLCGWRYARVSRPF